MINKKKFLVLLLSVLFITCLLSTGLEINPINYLYRHQIFTYMKSVQKIEDQFYELVQQRKSYSRDNSEEYVQHLQESIQIIDNVMMELITIEAKAPIYENKLLFLQEMKIIRDMNFEEIHWLRAHDEVSKKKSDNYLNEYNAIAKQRRMSLKQVFDRYNILYIDLGDRIKYKTRNF